jgi:hypothetical protein
VRFPATAAGVVALLRATIAAGSTAAEKTEGRATVSFAGYSHSFSGRYDWNVPPRIQSSSSRASVA